MLDEISQDKPSSGSSLASAAHRRAVTLFRNHCISKILVSGSGWVMGLCLRSVTTSPERIGSPVHTLCNPRPCPLESKFGGSWDWAVRSTWPVNSGG